MKKICPKYRMEYGRLDNYCTKCGIELEKQNKEIIKAMILVMVFLYVRKAHDVKTALKNPCDKDVKLSHMAERLRHGKGKV